MNNKNISYFRLLLLDFLNESHPELSSDDKFISARSEAAIDVYEQAIRNGDNHIEAEEQANKVLFKDLHFSRHDTLVNILWNEFSDVIHENEAREWAIRLFAECKAVFAKYSLSDDFAYEPEFDLLYTELTRTIAIYLEEHGIQ
ncbi:MAG: DUF1896 domain-containing protein [Prevotellaceae bacterium]|jgi:hypothetical protein|nr:DUF1896 domain-containing protein [Prevotellaceae bacterium]